MRDLVKGLVLKATPHKETSLILTVLTESGVVYVIARGAKGQKNKKASVLFAQPFVYSEFNIDTEASPCVAYSADALCAFYELRLDIEALALAGYFGEIAALSPQGSDTSELLRLMLNSLSLLINPKIDHRIVKAAFEMKYAQIEGVAPTLDGICAVCGEKPCVWDYDEGFVCKKCANGRGVTLSDAVLSGLDRILNQSGAAAYAFILDDESLAFLNRLTETYISQITDRKFQTLEYYYKLTDGEL